MRTSRPRPAAHAGARETAADLDAPAAVRALHVAIPLRPQKTPTALPPQLPQAVKDEYAIRYLQQIGAGPSPKNIALVLQHLPLESCSVSAAWRSRGSLADVLAIDLNPKTPALASLAETNARSWPTADRGPTTEGDALQQLERHQRNLNQHRVYRVGPVCLSFDDMKRKYLLPFKLASRPVEVDVLAAYGMKGNRVSEASSSETPSTADQSTKAQLNDALQALRMPTMLQKMGRLETQRRQKCLSERSVAPTCKTETVRGMHKAFYLALPLASLGLPESDERARVLLFETLLSDAMVELVQATARYLYLQVLHSPPVDASTHERSSSSAQVKISEQETLFVSIVRHFAALRAKLERQQRQTAGSGMYSSLLVVHVPLVLLALRVDVETLMRSQYPLNFATTSEEMQAVLSDMDERVSQILDPDAHLSRLAVLETTHEAAQAMTSTGFQRNRRNRHLREQFFQTSAALHNLFPNPASGKCRRVITLRGGAGVSRYPELATPIDRTKGGRKKALEYKTPPLRPQPPAAKEVTRAEKKRVEISTGSDETPVSVECKLKLLRLMRRTHPSPRG